jgi:hypothetical protein
VSAAPSRFTAISAVPIVTPVTIPVESTVAIDGALELHLARACAEPTSPGALPMLNERRAERAIARVIESAESITGPPARTVTSDVSALPCPCATTRADPGECAEISPAAVTLATAGLSLAQLTEAVVPTTVNWCD